jgi:hypothetical protein
MRDLLSQTHRLDDVPKTPSVSLVVGFGGGLKSNVHHAPLQLGQQQAVPMLLSIACSIRVRKSLATR